jgi:hypothetical protein
MFVFRNTRGRWVVLENNTWQTWPADLAGRLGRQTWPADLAGFLAGTDLIINGLQGCLEKTGPGRLESLDFGSLQ